MVLARDQGFQSYKKQFNSWFGDGVVLPIGKMVEVSTADHNLVNQRTPSVDVVAAVGLRSSHRIAFCLSFFSACSCN